MIEIEREIEKIKQNTAADCKGFGFMETSFVFHV